jgi:hypothetical protein
MDTSGLSFIVLKESLKKKHTFKDAHFTCDPRLSHVTDIDTAIYNFEQLRCHSLWHRVCINTQQVKKKKKLVHSESMVVNLKLWNYECHLWQVTTNRCSNDIKTKFWDQLMAYNSLQKLQFIVRLTRNISNLFFTLVFVVYISTDMKWNEIFYWELRRSWVRITPGFFADHNSNISDTVIAIS